MTYNQTLIEMEEKGKIKGIEQKKALRKLAAGTDFALPIDVHIKRDFK